MNDPLKARSIVLFDGFCNFCSASVLFIIRRDPGKRFLFAASQSPEGKSLIREYGIGKMSGQSIILISDRKIYMKSGAALRVARRLSGFWPAVYAFIILPPAFRDFFYDFFARNRYRLFGRREKCFVPHPGIRDRFIGT
jgi:predicted DCC family thiol-disulfide oxidoreductase YuxK